MSPSSAATTCSSRAAADAALRMATCPRRSCPTPAERGRPRSGRGAVRAARGRRRRQRAASDGRGRALRRLRAQDRAAVEREGGLETARVNLTTRRLTLRWQGDAGAGQPAGARRGGARLRRRAVRPRPAAFAGRPQRERELLRCVAVAGFAAGNVMLLAVAVWAGHVYGMGEATRDLPALVRGADRAAGDRLCRAAVLPLGLARAARRPHQHGRADLARRDAGTGDEPVRDRPRRRSTPISTAPSRCCSSC